MMNPFSFSMNRQNQSWIHTFFFIVVSQVACLITGHVSSSLAVEPDPLLFSSTTEERQAAYADNGLRLSKKIAETKDEKEKEYLLVQQQILARLQDLPDTLQNPAPANIFSELAGKDKLAWEELERYLNRYIEILIEERQNTQSLKNSDKQSKVLRSRLTALADDSPEISMLQLQYAYNIRQHSLYEKNASHLASALEIAKKYFPVVLLNTRIDRQAVSEEEKRLAEQKNQYQNIMATEALAFTSNDVRIQQQENLLQGYGARDLTRSEKDMLLYEQSRLIALRVEPLLAESNNQRLNLEKLQQEQKLAWYLLLSDKSDFLRLRELASEVLKQTLLLKKDIRETHDTTYSLEKELLLKKSEAESAASSTKQHLFKTYTAVQKISTGLALVEQKAEALEQRGELLDRAIDLRQTGMGAVVTRAREVSGNIVGQLLFILQFPLITYSGATISLLVLLQVAFLCTLGFFLNRLYGKFIRRIGQQRALNERTLHLLLILGKYPLIFLSIMISLSVLGINTSSFAMIAGALSVGIGFGLQTIVNNLVSGIILLFDKSIQPGDFISLGGGLQDGGLRGNVVQMNIRATVLRTNDNISVIVPNADFIAAKVVNWTYSDERVRFRVPFSVAYGTDADHVKQLVKSAILKLDIVLNQPEPSVFMSAHADSGVGYLAAVWVEGQNARRPVRTIDTILTCVYKTLNEHHIEIPFPQMDVHMRSS